jgi:hypothetical protein
VHGGHWAGVRDADLFSFDPDTSWDAEDDVIRRGAELFAMVIRPNRSPAPRHLDEAKARQWKELWPELTVLPWS